MKTAVGNLLLLGCAATAYAAATLSPGDAHAAAICGDLGVLDVDTSQLPEGVSPADLRMCGGHPNGDVRVLNAEQGASLAPVGGGLEWDTPSADVTPPPSSLSLGERACYYAAPYGCSGGYCWKSCGQNGQWCWTASNGGIGAWNKCSTFSDCGTNSFTQACGKGCVTSRSCGCSC